MSVRPILVFLAIFARRSAIAFTFAIAAACGGDPGGGGGVVTPTAQITAVTISPATIQLNGAGQTATLTVAVTSTEGSVASPTVEWTSSDPAIATVSGNGTGATVTAVAAGSATIRAKSGSITGTAEVTVLLPSSVALVVAPATAAAGGSVTTSVTIQRNNYTLPVTLELLGAPVGVTGAFGSGGRPTPGSSEVQALVLTIVANVVPGKYSLSVRATGTGLATVTQPFELTVLAPAVASVAVVPNKGEILVGATLQLAAVTRTADSAVVTGRAIAWTSSAPSRASVSGTGLVTGIAAGDSVTITATSEGISASARILVRTVSQGSQLEVDVSSCADPNGWFAVQDGANAAWTRVPNQGSRFSIAPNSSRIGLTYVSSGWTSIVFIDRTELSTLPMRYLCNPPSAVANDREIGIRLASNTPIDAILTGRIGDASTFVLPSVVSLIGPIQLPAPRSGRHDIALLLTGKPDSLRVVVRRDVDMTSLPDGAVAQTPLDFFGGESSAIESASMSLAGFPAVGSIFGYLGYEPFAVFGRSCRAALFPRENGFVDLGSLLFGDTIASPIPDQFATRSELLSGIGPIIFGRGEIDGGYRSTGPAASLLRPGEVVGGIASYLNLTGATEGEARIVAETYSALAARTIQAPSGMPHVYPSIVNGAAYRRFRVQLTLPPDLDDAFVARFRGTDARTISMRASAAWLQGRSVDLTLPDFTNVAGWDNRWGPNGQTEFELRGEKSNRSSACSIGRTAISMWIGVA